MSQAAETVQPSPEIFFDALMAYQRAAALKAAIELDVFTAIAEGAQTPDTLAEKCNASARGLRILCDYLVIGGFLTKAQNQYALTPDSAAFLDRRSPAYVGSAVDFLASPMMVEAFNHTAESVRKGGTAMSAEGSMEPEHPVWVDFARAMAPLMAMPAGLIAQLLDADAGESWKVLDIAAGHGIFGITLAKHNQNAEIFAVDWANVLAVAEENAQAAGVSDRHHKIIGSAFDVEFGEGYDIVLLTNFLHHFDQATIETLLRKVHAALKPGGRAVTLEFVPNADRISPPTSAAFSIIMLTTTASGDAYTFAEFDEMFRNAGFASSELHALPPSFQQVVISVK
jgi:2-polyprenyl-3-methyl-5-hydroxy-6-metoxy-1,4-benzoquinol methylase